jgi:CheY-like chemotaxis protein
MTNESATKKHVLVVDDEPDFAALLQSILSKAGYAVSVAHGCEDALKKVRDNRPDIITLDMQMPQKSGPLLYRTLKADDDNRSIPVVVVTAVTVADRDMENLVRSLLAPDSVPQPEAFLEKPIEGPELLETLQKVLSASPVPAVG